MRYFVTFTKPLGSPPAAVDIDFPDAESALQHARDLLAEGKQDVAINDDRGKRIAGSELAHCCIGTKKLNADLTTR